MVTCPSCGSSRIRNDYKPAPIVLRVIGIRALLCDNCNFQFRACSPLPPKNRRPRNPMRNKAESFLATESVSPGKVDLEKLDFPALPAEKREQKLALPISAKPSSSLQPMQMGVAVAAGQSQPAIVSGVAVDQIAPARQDLRTEITKLYALGASPERAANASHLAQEAVDSTALACPECGSHNIKRRKRNLLEKTFLSFTDHKPYICRKCDAAFYAKSVEQD